MRSINSTPGSAQSQFLSIILAHTSTAETVSYFLPWPIRYEVGLNTFRLLRHFYQNGIISCQFGPQQFGVKRDLTVLQFDLGQYFYNFSGKLGDDKPCASVKDCTFSEFRFSLECHAGVNFIFIDDADAVRCLLLGY